VGEDVTKRSVALGDVLVDGRIKDFYFVGDVVDGEVIIGLEKL